MVFPCRCSEAGEHKMPQTDFISGVEGVYPLFFWPPTTSQFLTTRALYH